MKAIRLVPGQMVNPFFSSGDRREAVSRSEAYDVPQFLTLPKGQDVDDPDCWKLCLGESPVMKPADDECRAKVFEIMGSEKRTAFLRRLKSMSHPDVRKQMSKAQVEWLDSMLETYGGEVETLDGKKPEPKKPPVPPSPTPSPAS
jgi:hypothetical protein